MLKGIAASAGVGTGKAVIVQREEIVIPMRKVSDPSMEQQRFLNAVGTFCANSLTAYHAARGRIGEKEANILTAQIIITTDPEMHKEVVDFIHSERVCAEYAFAVVCDKYIDLFGSMEDELMRSRSADFLDIKVGMICLMQGKERQNLFRLPRGSVLVAENIAPSQALRINPHAVSAIVTQAGTPQSHVSIIAGAMRIPVVVAVDGLLKTVHEGEYLLVDGDRGEVLCNQEIPAAGKFHTFHKAIPILGGH